MSPSPPVWRMRENLGFIPKLSEVACIDSIASPVLSDELLGHVRAGRRRLRRGGAAVPHLLGARRGGQFAQSLQVQG